MFFNRRRKFNGQVAALLPAFGLTLEEAGPMKTLEALDLIYPKNFSAYEGAYYIAHLCYAGMMKNDVVRANSLRPRIEDVETDWNSKGLVRDILIDGYRKKREQWESGDFSVTN